MNAYITLHAYDGGVYAVLSATDGRCTCLAESTLYPRQRPFYAIRDMQRYAKQHGIRVVFTETDTLSEKES